MITNPFSLLGCIFSEISEQGLIGTLLKSEGSTKEKIADLSKEIISILKHPRDRGLKPSNFFEITNRIVRLRNSPHGKVNYANCEGAIQKIEMALDRYGKKIFIGHSSVTKYFRNEKDTCLGINILIETFKENDLDKIPLTLVYKLQNLSILAYPKELSLFVQLINKAPDKPAYLDLVLKHLAGDLNTSLLTELNKESDGGFNLLCHANSVFDFHELNSTCLVHKLFLLKVMALFLEVGQVVDKQIFIDLLSNKTLDKTEADLLKTLTKIPKKNRMPALQHAVKFFSKDLGIWEKFTYILEVSLSPENKGDPLKIATLFKNLRINHYFISIENAHLLPIEKDFRTEMIEDAMKIYLETHGDEHAWFTKILQIDFEQKHNKIACKILNIMFQIRLPREKRLLRLNEIKKISPYLYDAMDGKEVARALHALSQTQDDADMRDAMQSIYRLLNEKIIDFSKSNFLFQPYSMIASVPVEERDEIIDLVIKASRYLDIYFEQLNGGILFTYTPFLDKNDLVTIMMLLSREERELLLHILADATFIFDYFPFHLTKNFALEFSLFLTSISSNEKLLQSLRSGDLKTSLTLEDYINAIISSASTKLMNIEGISKEALMALCLYLFKNQTPFLLFEEHPAMLQAMDFLSLLNLHSVKNPFILHKKLLDLSKQPVNFQSKPVKILGYDVCFNMKAFEEMSLSAIIERKEVPKEATLEAYNLLISNLTEKYENNPKNFNDAISDLNPDLLWTKISQESTLISLRGLLTLTGGHVNEVEAKWRKVLTNILTKSAKQLTGNFFTEQEQVLITTQYGIQSCSIGIRGGIEDAYQNLPSSFKYKNYCLSFKTNSDLLHEVNQKSALEFLCTFVNPNLNLEELSLLLLKENPKTLIERLPSLIGNDLSFWNVTSTLESDPLDDPLAEWHLTPKGAKAALHAAFKTKEQVRAVLVPILHEFIEGIFNRGNDAVIKHFVGDIEIKQGVHQSLYIKNLIGHAVGLSKHISKDPHVACIYEELTNASVNEVLEVFFEKHPLKHFMKEVIRVINQDPIEYRKELPTYFDRPAFWDIENNLTLQGTLELFIQSEFVHIS